MKGREDGGEEEEIKDGKGVLVQGGRLTGGVRWSACVCVCVKAAVDSHWAIHARNGISGFTVHSA